MPEKTFVSEGELVLSWSPAGCDWDVDDVSLGDRVSEFFGTIREKYTGDRYIGKVRITIEKLDDEDQAG